MSKQVKSWIRSIFQWSCIKNLLGVRHSTKKGRHISEEGKYSHLPHQCPTSSVSLFKVAVFLVKFSSDSWNRLSDTKISIKGMGDPWKTSICKTKRTCLQLKYFFISCTGARSWAGTQFIIPSTYLLGLTQIELKYAWHTTVKTFSIFFSHLSTKLNFFKVKRKRREAVGIKSPALYQQDGYDPLPS